MKITDEILSGFLDAELPEEQMEAVREALETDDDLLIRLAELSQVDEWVVQHAQQIDNKPVPKRIRELAAQLDTENSVSEQSPQSNVVSLPFNQKIGAAFKAPMAMAAGVLLAVTVGILSVGQSTDNLALAEVSKVLDASVSGEKTLLANDMSVKPQLSFTNQDGQFCRQYETTTKQKVSTSIACKKNSEWLIYASTQEHTVEQSSYVAATDNKELDQIIDSMISGAPLNRNQEKQAIAKQWLINQTN